MNALLMKGFASASYAHVIAKEIDAALLIHAAAIEDPDMLEKAREAGAGLVAAAAQFAREMEGCRELFEHMTGPVSIPVAIPSRNESGGAHI